jgi:hypothetical protein
MVMKPIKVNADYESVLYQNKSLPTVNEALEFLAFFIESTPVFTNKKYSPVYLNHVEALTGLKPTLVNQGQVENWWGPLKDLDLERKLNSKEMSAAFIKSQGWCQDTQVISTLSDLPPLDKTYLAKNPYGMSGQNFSLVSDGRLENIEAMLKKGKVVLEPLLNRTHDFSTYIFPNATKIFYQNIVDQKFQYRGTLFNDYTQPGLKELSFYSLLGPNDWTKFETGLQLIIDHYTTPEMPCGFSIDSFIHKEKNDFKIRYLSEVNYRRTMGQIAFALSLKFGGLRKWSLFILTKKANMDFSSIKERIAPLAWAPENTSGVVQLSPDGVRYDMFFLTAVDAQEGFELFEELKRLLPDTEFSVEL